jgi:hypothetical protein
MKKKARIQNEDKFLLQKSKTNQKNGITGWGI